MNPIFQFPRYLLRRQAIALTGKFRFYDPSGNLVMFSEQKMFRLREDVRGRIRDLAKQLGSTVLYVTHDQVEAMALADRIALLRDGEVLQVGTPEELYAQPRRADVADFFGLVNWVEGRLDEPGWASTPLGPLAIAAGTTASVGERLLIGFRPETLQVVPELGGRPGLGRLRGRLVSSVFLGDQVVYTVQVNGRSLTGKSRLPPGRPGEEIELGIAPEDVLVFPGPSGPPIDTPTAEPQDRLITT